MSEFFELFKTPWEFYRPDRHYDVLLAARDDFVLPVASAAEVVVIFGSRASAVDLHLGIECAENLPQPVLAFGSDALPIYGSCSALRGSGVAILIDPLTRRSAALVYEHGDTVVARIAYDLFVEVRTLLTVGQPIERAHIRALDAHVNILRDVIVSAGVEVIEVPPAPVGYKFIASLTHDVDHPRIRLHKFDHTIAGFLYRAVIGSLVRVCSRRIPFRHLVHNWAAVLSLPLVYFGLAKDFWYGFSRYTIIEGDTKSTFFVLPFSGQAGRSARGAAPKKRASAYGVSDIADRVRELVGAGCEVGLHGLDAWIETPSGNRERDAIASVAGKPVVGVRMHWLYFDGESPRKLEAAGFTYDSTVGYNDTIGFRAGTGQVYKLLGTQALLELPLHVMDTALFYPNYLNLSYAEAARRIGRMIEHATKCGGVLTLNWHDRSIAPERQWEEFYVGLLADLNASGAWCTSAHRAVCWFKKRRAVQFVEEGGCVRAIAPISEPGHCPDVPGVRLRRHKPHNEGRLLVDSVLGGSAVLSIGERKYFGLARLREHFSVKAAC